MRRVRIFLMTGETTRTVGLNISEDEGDEELRRVVVLIEDSLAKNFPNTKIIRASSTDKLFKNLG